MNSTRCETKKGRATIEIAGICSVRIPVPTATIALCHRYSTKNEHYVRERLNGTYDFVVPLAKATLDCAADVYVFGDDPELKCKGPTLPPGKYELLLTYNTPYARKNFLDIYHVKLDEEDTGPGE